MQGSRVLAALIVTTAAMKAIAQPAATIWERSVVSTAAPEFAVTFAPDGREAYFNRASADRSSFPIYVSRMAMGAWSTPELADFSPGGRDPDPFVTPDGRRLYFSSARPKQPGGASADLDIWYVDRQGDWWGPAVNAGAPVNTTATEVFVSTTRDGTLYFGSDRDGIVAIYRASRAGSGFASPERLPGVINGPEGASNPLISPDERWLFFVSTRAGGRGQSDIYVSERRADGWSPPRNLDAINSPYADFAPALSPDGRRFFFTSERPGIVAAAEGRPPGDIYSVDVPALGVPHLRR